MPAALVACQHEPESLPFQTADARLAEAAWRLPNRQGRVVLMPVTRPSSPLALGSGSAGLGCYMSLRGASCSAAAMAA